MSSALSASRQSSQKRSEPAALAQMYDDSSREAELAAAEELRKYLARGGSMAAPAGAAGPSTSSAPVRSTLAPSGLVTTSTSSNHPVGTDTVAELRQAMMADQELDRSLVEQPIAADDTDWKLCQDKLRSSHQPHLSAITT